MFLYNCSHNVKALNVHFGHVVPLYGEDVEPEEGDCRYSFHCSLSCQFFLLYTVNFTRRMYVPVIILNLMLR